MFLSREVTATIPPRYRCPVLSIPSTSQTHSHRKVRVCSYELQLIRVSFSRQLRIPLSVSVIISF